MRDKEGGVWKGRNSFSNVQKNNCFDVIYNKPYEIIIVRILNVYGLNKISRFKLLIIDKFSFSN